MSELIIKKDFKIPLNPKLNGDLDYQKTASIINRYIPEMTLENVKLSTELCFYIGMKNPVLQRQLLKLINSWSLDIHHKVQD